LAARLDVEVFFATVLAVLADVRADAVRPTTSDWPGKMSGRRRPFERINTAVVV
jgi:hypothetical protein